MNKGSTMQPSQAEISQAEKLWYIEAQKNLDTKQLIKLNPQVEDDGVMMLYLLDSHGAGRYTRFTVKANGTNERTGYAVEEN